jgi:hypothetical protein
MKVASVPRILFAGSRFFACPGLIQRRFIFVGGRSHGMERWECFFGSGLVQLESVYLHVEVKSTYVAVLRVVFAGSTIGRN